mmetsp:Transcript_9185/g.19604  ORF Transcript_9185/g.19604 Transcript_9185/m.19604 type:complete len:481 (+) Transcript_9185:275-1717(+)
MIPSPPDLSIAYSPQTCIVRRIEHQRVSRNFWRIKLFIVTIVSIRALFVNGIGKVGGVKGPVVTSSRSLWRVFFCRGHSSRPKQRTFSLGGSTRDNSLSFSSVFVSALPSSPPASRSTSSNNASDGSNLLNQNMPSKSCSTNADGAGNEAKNGQCSSSLPTKTIHPKDGNLWLYHVESTTSTMDVAKLLVENRFIDNNNENKNDVINFEGNQPTTFLISASSQSKGRGTTQRNWKSSQRGNALFTIGIQQSSWMVGLKSVNQGMMVPLTLLPLKVGSLVAFRVKECLERCVDGGVNATEEKQLMPMVTVKWPNDVLLRVIFDSVDDPSHEKIAGILIESSQDWFLIGIGINVGYAPDIPKEGADYGRQATCLSRFCEAKSTNGSSWTEEDHWTEVSKELARDLAYDLSSWLNQPPSSQGNLAESILHEWRTFVEWDMELVLRDTEARERVTLTSVLEDGRVVVKVKDTGEIRTLVADYFL